MMLMILQVSRPFIRGQSRRVVYRRETQQEVPVRNPAYSTETRGRDPAHLRSRIAAQPDVGPFDPCHAEYYLYLAHL